MSSASAQSRRLDTGQPVPEFTSETLDHGQFTYASGNKKVLLMAFLSANHERSLRAAEDLLRIVSELKCDPERLDFVVVIDKPEAKKYLETKSSSSSAIAPKVVLDSDIELWGLFGIIATPTVIIGDVDNKAVCIKPGYSYDFAPVIHSSLNKALGIAQDVLPDDASKVKVLDNNSQQARVGRYLQMINNLKDDEQYEPALMTAKKALAIDPNSVEIVLVVGELYCLVGNSKGALDAVEGKTTPDRFKQARFEMIKGWAYRRSGDLESAENHLLESVKLSPMLARAFFELGNVYLAAEKPDKAAQAYHSALSILLIKEQ